MINWIEANKFNCEQFELNKKLSNDLVYLMQSDNGYHTIICGDDYYTGLTVEKGFVVFEKSDDIFEEKCDFPPRLTHFALRSEYEAILPNAQKNDNLPIIPVHDERELA